MVAFDIFSNDLGQLCDDLSIAFRLIGHSGIQYYPDTIEYVPAFHPSSVGQLVVGALYEGGLLLSIVPFVSGLVSSLSSRNIIDFEIGLIATLLTAAIYLPTYICFRRGKEKKERE